MGLDGVSLVIAIEEGFGVTIADAEAEACLTPAAVIDLVFSKLRVSDQRVCVTQRAFYALRHGLVRTLGVARREVDLGTDVRSLQKGRSEREMWSDLRSAVHARTWPALTRPRWLTAGLWILSLGTFGALISQFHWVIAATATGLVATAAARLTRRFRTCIPARYSRLRELIPFAATSDTIVWTRDQVASLVKKLVIEELGLKEDQYREDAHFVKDLGMY